MTKQLQKTSQTAVQTTGVYTPSQVELIKRTVAVGATNDELQLFFLTATRLGLDPFTRQIFFLKRKVWNKIKNGYDEKGTIQVGIDGYRSIADRTGSYAGNDDPNYEFNEKDELIKATVTVYKIVGGVRCPFTSSARWDQYYPGEKQGFMWDKMPHLMLGKCAEALALRKAFPQQLSGVYVKEEMEQANGELITIENKADEPPFETPKIEAPIDEEKKKLIEIEQIVMKLNPEIPKENKEIKKAVFSLTNLLMKRESLDEILSRLQIKLTEKNFV